MDRNAIGGWNNFTFNINREKRKTKNNEQNQSLNHGLPHFQTNPLYQI